MLSIHLLHLHRSPIRWQHQCSHFQNENMESGRGYGTCQSHLWGKWWLFGLCGQFSLLPPSLSLFKISTGWLRFHYVMVSTLDFQSLLSLQYPHVEEMPLHHSYGRPKCPGPRNDHTVLYYHGLIMKCLSQAHKVWPVVGGSGSFRRK